MERRVVAQATVPGRSYSLVPKQNNSNNNKQGADKETAPVEIVTSQQQPLGMSVELREGVGRPLTGHESREREQMSSHLHLYCSLHIHSHPSHIL